MMQKYSFVPRAVGRATKISWKRALHIHSFQSQDLLKNAGLKVPLGRVAGTLDEVREAIKDIGKPCLIKPQIIQAASNQTPPDAQSANGVQLASSSEQGAEIASKILGHRIPSSPGNDDAHLVKRVYVEESIEYEQKWHLCLTIDRENYCPTIIIRDDDSIFQTQARNSSGHQFQFPFKFSEGITPAVIQRIASQLGLSELESQEFNSILQALYKIFVEKEAKSLEIGKLIRGSEDKRLVCIDSRFTFDDAAQHRQPEIFQLRDYEQEVGEEVEAENHGLVYVRMDGNIGNVVNGAGLAMATNDAISYYGGKSANFLDAGGKATKDTMLRAFDIIMRDERVTAILVNIYGGLTRCDMIAESIIAAASELGPLRVPVVVRLQGTNSELGLKLLEEANLGLHVEAGFGEASRKAVEAAKAAGA